MTSWEWICRKCGHVEIHYIGQFIDFCVACQQNYRVLAWAKGKSPGFPIYAMDTEPFENENTTNQILFAINCHYPSIVATDEDFYLYLKKTFKNSIQENNVQVIMGEN